MADGPTPPTQHVKYAGTTTMRPAFAVGML